MHAHADATAWTPREVVPEASSQEERCKAEPLAAASANAYAPRCVRSVRACESGVYGRRVAEAPRASLPLSLSLSLWHDQLGAKRVGQGEQRLLSTTLPRAALALPSQWRPAAESAGGK